VGWIGLALLVYLVSIVASAWRWQQLLAAQHVGISNLELVRSYLVATFFNNFLPSNIGGDVVRIRDTVAAAGSRTLAATVVLLDRGIGLLGLLLVAAAGAAVAHVGTAGQLPFGPSSLFLISGVGLAALAVMVRAPDLVGRLLAPLKRLHADWVEVRLQRLVAMFARFRARPSSLVYCLFGAVVVQALLVGFYAAVATSVRIPIPAAHLAVLIPLSFVVQMAPVSMNGFGVREATFSAYFRMLGLPIESALVLSLLGTASIMLFSLSGAALYAARR
ncbi:MAG: YbhN family protein, partial [Vicinamibacterales bacterium]